jgi:hypothetical protein
MEGLKTPVSVIWQVLKARTEGMGFNAAARTFEKVKNTIRYCWRTPLLVLNNPILDSKSIIKDEYFWRGL